MSNNPSLDIVTFLESEGIGKRMTDLFTIADQGAFENRPLAIIVRSPSGAGVPEVTEPVDYPSVTISIAGNYGQDGESKVYDKANEVYNALRLVLDAKISGTLYLCIRAMSSPAHVGLDENKRTVIEFNVDLIRYTGEVE